MTLHIYKSRERERGGGVYTLPLNENCASFSYENGQ
jgi:hypothetical protein